MTPEQLEKRIQELKKSGLTGTEKRAMLSKIYETPVPMPAEWSAGRSIFSYFASARYALAGLAIFFLAGSSAIYASEGAVPGDVLYPVKVAVAEPIRGALARTPEARVAWEEKKIERRLKEAEVLALRGDFDEPKRKVIEKEFEKHSDDLAIAQAKLAPAPSARGLQMMALQANPASDASAVSRTQALDQLIEKKEIHERDKKELKALREKVAMKLEKNGGPRKDEAAAAPQKEVTMRGTLECLLHRDRSGPVTAECAFGLSAENGVHYGLDLSKVPMVDWSGIPMGQKLSVTGTLEPADASHKKYDIEEILRVTKVEKAE
ncbi:hypothetical protein KW797_03065 [Candidatus Parcubacteria bacterium]|nr:hypothetical protein [Candidatus Parcubacteria bacterium]